MPQIAVLLRPDKEGINIEDFEFPLPKDRHRLKPNGLHTGPDHWNKQWKPFFDDSSVPPTKEQILDHLSKMRKQVGLE